MSRNTYTVEVRNLHDSRGVRVYGLTYSCKVSAKSPDKARALVLSVLATHGLQVPYGEVLSVRETEVRAQDRSPGDRIAFRVVR